MKNNLNIFLTLIFISTKFVLAESDSLTTIFIYGDNRGNKEIHQKIIDQFVQTNFTYILNTGDLVDFGYLQFPWNTFIETIKPVNDGNSEPPVYLAALGNHDVIWKNRGYSSWHKNLPWLPGNGEYYYYDYEDIRLIVLDSNNEQNFEVQTDSLTSWLTNNTKKWVLVSWHHPSFSFGNKENHLQSLQSWWPIIYEHKVDLVINGHGHYYARSFPIKPQQNNPFGSRDNENGIIQIITGGAGASHYKIEKDKHNDEYYDSLLAYYNDQGYHYCQLVINGNVLKLNVKDLNNHIIDRFILEKE